MNGFARSLVMLAAGFACAHAEAAILFVDSGIGSNCSDYDETSRSCGSGSATAFSSLAGGLGAVSAGDTLTIRGGSYGQLSVAVSGTASAPITIQGYPGEQVTISDSGAVALWIIGRSNVIIRDLTVSNVEGFGRLEESEGITIRNIDFSGAVASGTTGSLKFVRSSGNRVLDSSFTDGSDLLLLQDDSNRNVIQNSTFGTASHSEISIRCANQNVIRGTTFDNPDQKAVEIFDCEGVSDAPVRLDSALRNLLEKNRFMGTRASGKDNDYNAIQHGAQYTIVRLNVFAHNLGGGVNYQYYNDESLYVYGNRLYNNTFYDNRCYAIIGQTGSGTRFYDNRAVNNLLFDNRSCSGGGDQVRIEDSGSVILENNSLVDSDPGFVDAANEDFELLSTSSQVDAGTFVAEAAADGSGTALKIDDASWFYDGFGIPGETGDTIQIEGHSERARIVSIDYPANVLTLNVPLSWSQGDGVHLAYAGNAPQVGAFEFGLATVQPNPPTDLKISD